MRVSIGDVELSLPPRDCLDFSNPRRVVALRIPGAPPVLQDLGEEETVMRWEGSLVGDNAYRDAIRLESLKDSGAEVRVTLPGFNELNKIVRVRKFDWRLRRADRVDYSIELVAVIPPPVVVGAPPPVAQGTGADAGQGATATTEEANESSAVTHVVQLGDTLWALARRYLGDGRRWTEIADSNGVLDPRKLQVGQELVIPT